MNKSDEKLIENEIKYLLANSRFIETKLYIQHGSTTVFNHCINVACMSLYIADFMKKKNIRVNRKSLVRGALLHDYFLYDWHIPDKTHRLHGFTHPAKALENAKKDLMLNAIEKDIILRHMFPLTILPPMKRESWIVTLSDKICSFMETFNIHNINRKRHKFLPKGEKE